MKVVTPEISWHAREPIYSVDLQPTSGSIKRLATCGVDRTVRMWRIRVDPEGKVDVDFLSNLTRHTATVNVCRFSPDGKLLASAGDDAMILLWKLSDIPTPANNIFNDEDADNKESWVVHKTLRGHLNDVYDLCWSPDSRYIVSGSVDNSAIAWDIHKDVKLALFNEHKSYVQGVAWDPLREYIATLSSDRSCRIFNLATKHCIHNVSKAVMPHVAASTPEGTKPKAIKIFHDDTLRSFFRRLSFSPGGQLLIAPSGLMETPEGQTNATFIFTRGSFKEPACYLPSSNKASVAVRVCPCLFQLQHVSRGLPVEGESPKEWERFSTVFSLPYRVVFAVATEDTVVLYDSQSTMPLAYISNIHYHTLSDLTWSKDGRILIVSSTDGYCSMATFAEGELGIPYNPKSSSSGDVGVMDTHEPHHLKAPPAECASHTTVHSPSSRQAQATPDAENAMDVDADAAPAELEVATSQSADTPSDGAASSSPPATQSAMAVASEMESVRLGTSAESSGAQASACEELPEEKKQDKSKQPKRIQFTTLSLLKK